MDVDQRSLVCGSDICSLQSLQTTHWARNFSLSICGFASPTLPSKSRYIINVLHMLQEPVLPHDATPGSYLWNWTCWVSFGRILGFLQKELTVTLIHWHGGRLAAAICCYWNAHPQAIKSNRIAKVVDVSPWSLGRWDNCTEISHQQRRYLQRCGYRRVIPEQSKVRVIPHHQHHNPTFLATWSSARQDDLFTSGHCF